ncbi:unnamed protein product, partial [Protopolystoma xenopodis]
MHCDFTSLDSISLSVLGGKLMLRNLVIVNEDYTLRCCHAIIVLNYWVSYNPEKKNLEPQRRCLHIYLYGVDVHLYNRNSAYDALQSKSRGTGSMDDMWSRWKLLFPVIKFNFELTKLCAGNHLLPKAFILTCERASGVYTTRDATYAYDKYQHYVDLEFSNIIGSFVPSKKYSGHYAIEEPPQTLDNGIQIFNFGKGHICYLQDEPGVIPQESETLRLSPENKEIFCTWPRCIMTIRVIKNCLIFYSPWADRQ